ncbi:hypothetical protein Bpfe_030474 [Biomphalaria pfeifferi]|uniref:G-protein coupled receptors family 1 profile domain-containing protein n=1 Tax=Biomphalaria pfeifferi TaxID=112525 RepID=A0AAD8APK5_BIOPF|nr:hypothetical protein Bpfe_030474 [Biomphalaria pfeifferi]
MTNQKQSFDQILFNTSSDNVTSGTSQSHLIALSNNLNVAVVMTVIALVVNVFPLLLSLTLCRSRSTITCWNYNNNTRMLITSMAVVDVLMSLLEAPAGGFNGKWALGLPMLKVW